MMLKELCPTCNKEIKSVQTSFIAFGKLHEVYNCGHLWVKSSTITEEAAPKVPRVESDNFSSNGHRNFESNPPTKEELYNNLDRWVSEGGSYKKSPEEIASEEFWKSYETDEIWYSTDRKKKLRPYQYEGVRFAESAQLKCLIGDFPAAGKTQQALKVLARNKAIMLPCLVLVRGATIFQWAKETRDWYSDAFSSVIPVIDRIQIMPGFQVYIMSQDLLPRKGVLDLVKKLKIKSVIVDEAQFYKDQSSDRAKALFDLIETQKIEYRIFLSGTYIKNRMSEAFTVLNMCDPKNFNSPSDFNKRFLLLENGQYKRLNPVYAEQFKRLTSKYIIRREKKDCFKDLPDVVRDYQIIEITDPYIKKSYNHQLGLWESFKNDPKTTQTEILGWLAKLRAITGMAKASHAVEWVNEFLAATDDNITIGIHHKDVRETLFNVFKANKQNPLSLSGEDDSYEKNRIARDFNSGKNRILIMNMLAGGVGLSIHGCTNALCLERQWNSADEEQFEGRFRDLILLKKGVTITYLIAKGTIDEFFHDIVWKKRNILAEAGIGNPDEETSSITFLKEFAEFIAGKKI